MRPSADAQSSAQDRESKSARQVDWRVLSAHRWVRQRTSHNRSALQVTDQGLPAMNAATGNGETAVR